MWDIYVLFFVFPLDKNAEMCYYNNTSEIQPSEESTPKEVIKINKFSDKDTPKFAVRQYNPAKDCWEWLGIYLSKTGVARFYEQVATGKYPRELYDFVELTDEE